MGFVAFDVAAGELLQGCGLTGDGACECPKYPMIVSDPGEFGLSAKPVGCDPKQWQRLAQWRAHS